MPEMAIIRPSEDEHFAQAHIAKKWKNQDSNDNIWFHIPAFLYASHETAFPRYCKGICLTFRACHSLFCIDDCLHTRLTEVTNNLVLIEKFLTNTDYTHNKIFFGVNKATTHIKLKCTKYIKEKKLKACTAEWNSADKSKAKQQWNSAAKSKPTD